MSSILEPGAQAPDFVLPSHMTGDTVSLLDTLERGRALLVFYPGDFAPT